MFYINKNPILASELEVLQTLKSHLELNGLCLFNEFKVGVNNIQFNCPIHSYGQERKPSCGITISNREHTPSGIVHCFACGYTSTLTEMISDCFGKLNDNGQFGKDWLIKNFLTIEIENRPIIKLNFVRGNMKIYKPLKYVLEEELEKYRYYHNYMFERKLTNEIIEQFDVGYDDCFTLVNDKTKTNVILQCLTFPVRDFEGNTLFIARRGVNSKFFHYPVDVSKPVYGLYELPKDCNEIIICESIIDALTCYIHGKPALALLGLGTEYQYEQLKKLNARKFITALDPDKAGIAATKKIRKALNKYKLITSYAIPVGKDINDLDKEEFNNLEEIF